ncbi:hypothetical protein Q5752_006151 [Cryptotrichosporon argae]
MSPPSRSAPTSTSSSPAASSSSSLSSDEESLLQSSADERPARDRPVSRSTVSSSSSSSGSSASALSDASWHSAEPDRTPHRHLRTRRAVFRAIQLAAAVLAATAPARARTRDGEDERDERRERRRHGQGAHDGQHGWAALLECLERETDWSAGPAAAFAQALRALLVRLAELASDRTYVRTLGRADARAAQRLSRTRPHLRLPDAPGNPPRALDTAPLVVARLAEFALAPARRRARGKGEQALTSTLDLSACAADELDAVPDLLGWLKIPPESVRALSLAHSAVAVWPWDPIPFPALRTLDISSTRLDHVPLSALRLPLRRVRVRRCAAGMSAACLAADGLNVVSAGPLFPKRPRAPRSLRTLTVLCLEIIVAARAGAATDDWARAETDTDDGNDAHGGLAPHLAALLETSYACASCGCVVLQREPPVYTTCAYQTAAGAVRARGLACAPCCRVIEGKAKLVRAT